MNSDNVTQISKETFRKWFYGGTDDIVDPDAAFRPVEDPPRQYLYAHLSPYPLGILHERELNLCPELTLGYLLAVQSNFCESESYMWDLAMFELAAEIRSFGAHQLITSSGRRDCKGQHSSRRRCMLSCNKCVAAEGICLPTSKNAFQSTSISCLQLHILKSEELLFEKIVANPIKDVLGNEDLPGWKNLLPKSPSEIMLPHNLDSLRKLGNEVRSRQRCAYCDCRTTFFCNSCHLRSRSALPVPICLPWKGKGECYHQHIHEDFTAYYGIDIMDTQFATGNDVSNSRVI